MSEYNEFCGVRIFPRFERIDSEYVMDDIEHNMSEGNCLVIINCTKLASVNLEDLSPQHDSGLVASRPIDSWGDEGITSIRVYVNELRGSRILGDMKLIGLLSKTRPGVPVTLVEFEYIAVETPSNVTNHAEAGLSDATELLNKLALQLEIGAGINTTAAGRLKHLKQVVDNCIRLYIRNEMNINTYENTSEWLAKYFSMTEEEVLGALPAPRKTVPSSLTSGLLPPEGSFYETFDGVKIKKSDTVKKITELLTAGHVVLVIGDVELNKVPDKLCCDLFRIRVVNDRALLVMRYNSIASELGSYKNGAIFCGPTRPTDLMTDKAVRQLLVDEPSFDKIRAFDKYRII